MHNLSNIPIPQPVLQKFWDFIVQGAANIAQDRGRPDIARNIEKLRATPNLARMVSDAVMEGWRVWMSDDAWPALKIAIVTEAITHFPTLYQKKLQDALSNPAHSADVESFLAEWFHSLPAGLSMSQCRRAAHDLFEDIVHAAMSLDKAALHDLVGNIMQWETLRKTPPPKISTRLHRIEDGAHEVARSEQRSLVGSAHLLYALSALYPARDPQSALHIAGATPSRILRAIADMESGESSAGDSTPTRRGHSEPKFSSDAQVMRAEATALAREEQAAVVDDLHLLRAALTLAADERCDAGAGLRALFSQLGIHPEDWGNALAAQRSLPTISAGSVITISRLTR